MSIPHDPDAELSLLGGLIHVPERILDAEGLGLTQRDFYNPTYGTVYATVVDLYRNGHLGGGLAGDLTVIANELATRGTPVSQSDLLSWSAGGYPRVESLVPIITRHAVRRRLLSALLDATESARDETVDPLGLRDDVRAALGEIEVPLASATPENLSTLDDFVARADSAPAPWVMPGLFRRGWRVVIVATEGGGKSTLCRQIAMCGARGVHPFTGRQLSGEPIRTMLIDLENPADAIASIATPITNALDRIANVDDEGRSWIWHEPSGINLRNPRDRVRLEAAIIHAQPDLVCIGPGYKLYTKGRDTDEDAVLDVFKVLDDLRVRHDFALMIEHHAPKGGGLMGREMEPHGTALWKRWPEIGLAARLGDGEREPVGSLTFGRFRGDRMKNSWPDRVDRSTNGLPWTGYWENGLEDLR